MSNTQTKPTQAVEKKAAMVEITPLGSNEKFKLSVAMVKSMIAVKTKQGHTATDADCIKFIALCQARKLNPFEGDAYLIGYDTQDGPKFNLITAHQAFLKRAELNPEFDGMKSGIIVERTEGDETKMIDLEGDFHLETDKVVGGWASVHFKNRKVPMMKRVRLKRFQKPFGIWKEDPAGMICKCAEADALRSSFPTMCGGMYLKEEYKEDQPSVAGAAAPLFTSKEAPVVEAEAVEEPPPSAPSPRERIKILCEECGILEADLLAYVASIDLAEDDVKSIEELSDESVDAILSDWDKHEAKIKEVTSR